MASVTFLILTPLLVYTNPLYTVTGGRIEPVLINGGPQAGNFALPLSVLSDPMWAGRRIVLSTYPQATIDTAAAWPSGGTT